MWEPLPTFNRTDADVSIYIVAYNAVRYRTPVRDPLFRADDERRKVDLSDDVSFWHPNAFTGVLGCIDQYTICNPVTQKCLPFSGGQELWDGASAKGNSTKNLRMNIAQAFTFGRLVNAIQFSSTEASVYGLASGGKSAALHS